MQPPLPLVGFNILVVDDDDDSRFYISTVLEADGARVTAVESAATALELLPKLRPDVLICDIAMPGENGYDLIRQVRQLKPEKGGRVLAVALTAYADSEDRMQALKAGFQTHIGKPVEPEKLVGIIAHLVAHYRH